MRTRPAGSAVVRAPCLRQNEHAQARRTSARGSRTVSNSTVMFPQWHWPRSTASNLHRAAQDRSGGELSFPFAQERDEAPVEEGADGRRRIGKAVRQFPLGRASQPKLEIFSRPQAVELGARDFHRRAPGIEAGALDLPPARFGVKPRSDGGALQFGQMTKCSGGAAEIACEGADVIAAASDQLEHAGSRQV